MIVFCRQTNKTELTPLELTTFLGIVECAIAHTQKEFKTKCGFVLVKSKITPDQDNVAWFSVNSVRASNSDKATWMGLFLRLLRDYGNNHRAVLSTIAAAETEEESYGNSLHTHLLSNPDFHDRTAALQHKTFVIHFVETDITGDCSFDIWDIERIRNHFSILGALDITVCIDYNKDTGEATNKCRHIICNGHNQKLIPYDMKDTIITHCQQVLLESNSATIECQFCSTGRFVGCSPQLEWIKVERPKEE